MFYTANYLVFERLAFISISSDNRLVNLYSFFLYIGWKSQQVPITTGRYRAFKESIVNWRCKIYYWTHRGGLTCSACCCQVMLEDLSVQNALQETLYWTGMLGTWGEQAMGCTFYESRLVLHHGFIWDAGCTFLCSPRSRWSIQFPPLRCHWYT